MLRHKLIGLLIYFYAVLNNLPADNHVFENIKRDFKIRRTGRMPLLESSGLMKADSATLFWTHADSGNEAALYLIDESGTMLDTVLFSELRNIDWEDITKDNEGNIYIGDFGNNANKRRSLSVIKLDSKGRFMGRIQFVYADQLDFPPEKKKSNFDCEGFFWADGQLHLFSKNRGDKCVKHYALPDIPGVYEVTPLSNIFLRAPITGADIHIDQEEFVLLGYGKIYFFNWTGAEQIFSSPKGKVKFKRSGAAEAIAYINERDLLISNESGKLWKLKRK